MANCADVGIDPRQALGRAARASCWCTAACRAARRAASTALRSRSRSPTRAGSCRPRSSRARAQPRPGRPDDAEADGAWVAELLDDGAHLVGHSFGGCVALAAAAKRPGAVHSLTLDRARHAEARDERPARAPLRAAHPVRRLLSLSAVSRAKRFMKIVGIPAGDPEPGSGGAEAARQQPRPQQIPDKQTLARQLGEIQRASIPLLVVTGGWSPPSRRRGTSSPRREEGDTRWCRREAPLPAVRRGGVQSDSGGLHGRERVKRPTD